MRRRQVITLLGGTVAAWPLAARAQQLERVRGIGSLAQLPENDPELRKRLAAFVQALQNLNLGWRDGQNVRIDYRHALGKADNARRYAAELVKLAPDVILAEGSSSTGPLLEATRAVPIVFVLAPDPVGAGFVESLARPGGNATGFSQAEYATSGKWLGAAQRGRTSRDAGGGTSRPRHRCGDRPVRRYSGGRSGAWD